MVFTFGSMKAMILTAGQSDAHFASERKLYVIEIGERFVETLGVRDQVCSWGFEIQALIQLSFFLFQVGIRLRQSLRNIFQPSLLRFGESFLELLVPVSRVLEGCVKRIASCGRRSIFLARGLQKGLQFGLRRFRTFHQSLELRNLLAAGLCGEHLMKVLQAVFFVESGGSIVTRNVPVNSTAKVAASAAVALCRRHERTGEQHTGQNQSVETRDGNPSKHYANLRTKIRCKDCSETASWEGRRDCASIGSKPAT